MSDTELNEEQLKEQKLEEARKKYEALKKKTKKKAKKSKKKGTDDTENKEDTPHLEGGANDEDEEDTPVAEPQAELKPEETEDIRSDAVDNEKNSTEEGSADAVAETTEAPIAETETRDATVVEAKSKEQATYTEETDSKPVEELTKKVEDLAILVEPKTEQSVDSLFPDSGPSFVESIEQSKQEEEIKKLKEANMKFEFENDELKEQVAALTNENKELKFVKIHHQEEIETLQAQVADLESKLAKAKVDWSNHSHPQQLMQTAYDFDENVSLSPTPSFNQPQFSSSFSQFNLGRNESTLSLGEVKARLNKWKGWNVDMSSWRTVGSGPVVEL